MSPLRSDSSEAYDCCSALMSSAEQKQTESPWREGRSHRGRHCQEEWDTKLERLGSPAGSTVSLWHLHSAVYSKWDVVRLIRNEIKETSMQRSTEIPPEGNFVDCAAGERWGLSGSTNKVTPQVRVPVSSVKMTFPRRKRWRSACVTGP